MSRLYSDLQQSSGRRFYFALDSAPGIITPAPATLTLLGQVPAAAEPTTGFRTPTPAALTFQGLSFGAPTTLAPAPATLTMAGQIPAEVRTLTISPALPAPVESPPNQFVPTLVTIWTTNPTTAQLTLQTLEQNVTQGGNIGFVSPGRAQLSIGTLNFTLLVLSGGAGLGTVSIVGLAPTLTHALTITPEVGRISTSQISPVLGLPFRWVDDDPAPASAWITDAAA